MTFFFFGGGGNFINIWMKFWKPIGGWKLIRHPSWSFFAPVNSSGLGVPPPSSTYRLQLLCQCFPSMQCEPTTLQPIDETCTTSRYSRTTATSYGAAIYCNNNCFVIIYCHLTKVSAQTNKCIIFEPNELPIALSTLWCNPPPFVVRFVARYILEEEMQLRFFTFFPYSFQVFETGSQSLERGQTLNCIRHLKRGRTQASVCGGRWCFDSRNWVKTSIESKHQNIDVEVHDSRNCHVDTSCLLCVWLANPVRFEFFPVLVPT